MGNLFCHCNVEQYLVSFLVVQSAPWCRNTWLLYFVLLMTHGCKLSVLSPTLLRVVSLCVIVAFPGHDLSLFEDSIRYCMVCIKRIIDTCYG